MEYKILCKGGLVFSLPELKARVIFSNQNLSVVVVFVVVVDNYEIAKIH